MYHRRDLGQYDRVRVETAGRMDLVILCYEKAILFLGRAKTLYQEGRFDQKFFMLDKAIGIINELNAALDMEKGGEIAKNLDAIYNYLMRILLQGDVKREMSAFDEAIQILSDLKGAWESIVSEPQIDKTADHHDFARPTASQVAA